MSTQAQCSCQAAPKLIFPCSGASDVGGLSDRAARVLVIDGCPQECARKTMELAGFKDFQHLSLAEMGCKKSETPVTPARIREVADKGAELLAC
jgi:uncharacterized metal-binding protein